MEELKEIAGLISSLGEAGITAFIVWVVLSKATDIVIAVVVFTGLYRLARGIVAAVAVANAND